MCVWFCVHVYIWMWRSEDNLGVIHSSGTLHTVLLSQGLSLTRASPVRLGWLTSKPQGTSPSPPSQHLQAHATYLAFWHGFWALNCGPNSTSTLPIQVFSWSLIQAALWVSSFAVFLKNIGEACVIIATITHISACIIIFGSSVGSVIWIPGER